MVTRGLNFRRFLSVSTLYAVGDLVTKGARFILVPYYVQVLTKAELGTLGFLQAISIAAWTVFAMSSGFVIPRYYFEYKKDGDRFVSAIWWGRMLAMIAPCAALMALTWFLAPRIIPSISPALITISLLTGFLRAGFNVIESWFVIREQPVRYRTFTFIQFLTTTLMIIYLVSVQKMGVAGVVIGEAVSFSFWTIISGYLVTKVGRFSLSSINWRVIGAYCVTLLPHTVFMWALSYSDRLVLQQFVSLKDLGIYEFAYTLASSLTVAALAMRSALLPRFFRAADSNGAVRAYGESASYFFAITLFTATSLVAFAPEAVWLISAGSYLESVAILRIVVVGLIGHAFFMAMNQPLLYENKNGWISAASFLAATTNLILNFIWIPTYGIYGAAYSTLFAYFLLAVVGFVLTRRYHQSGSQRIVLLAGGVASLIVGSAACGLAMAPFAVEFAGKLALLAGLFALFTYVLWRGRGEKIPVKPLALDSGQPDSGNYNSLACPAPTLPIPTNELAHPASPVTSSPVSD